MGLDPTQLRLAPQWLPFYRSGLRYILRSESPSPGSPPEDEEPSRSSRTREDWLRWLERLSPPYTVLLSYWTLSLDRRDGAQQASRQRLDLFSRMLTGLAWPDTEYAFWPVSDCPGGELVADTDLFLRGIRVLRPRYVVLFGARAAGAVFPDLAPDTSRLDREGVTYVFLPDPDDMLPDNRRAKNIVWHSLKSLPVASARD